LKTKTKRSKSEETLFNKIDKELSEERGEMEGRLPMYQGMFDALTTLEKHFGKEDITEDDIKTISDNFEDLDDSDIDEVEAFESELKDSEVIEDKI
jgi:hypothetical protein